MNAMTHPADALGMFSPAPAPRRRTAFAADLWVAAGVTPDEAADALEQALSGRPLCIGAEGTLVAMLDAIEGKTL